MTEVTYKLPKEYWGIELPKCLQQQTNTRKFAVISEIQAAPVVAGERHCTWWVTVTTVTDNGPTQCTVLLNITQQQQPHNYCRHPPLPLPLQMLTFWLHLPYLRYRRYNRIQGGTLMGPAPTADHTHTHHTVHTYWRDIGLHPQQQQQQQQQQL